MNSNFFIGVVLAMTLGTMMYAIGYTADKQIERMQAEQSEHELTALINKY